MALLDELIDALKRLPGVGQKSAQRMAFHLLERDRPGATRLGEKLRAAVEQIHHCQRCRSFTEHRLCAICANPQRDASVVCVVESVADLHALEAATGYRGRYFVLHGRLSPLDGLGPSEIGLPSLVEQLGEGTMNEMIIATNPTVEGEATAHYLAELARAANVKPTRIAHGIPMGGELEYIDRNTLAHAFGGRLPVP